MRLIFQGTARDGNGKAIAGATITATVSGAAASLYTSATSTTAVSTITASSTDGSYSFYTDDFDYDTDAVFALTFSAGSLYDTVTYTNVRGTPVLGTYSITDDTTVTTNLRVPKGVIYEVAPNKTLTLNGTVEAGPYQIISLIGTGAVAGTAQLAPYWVGTGTAAVTAMQETSDPYPASTATTPTDRENEIQQLRYLIKQITGGENWYTDPLYPIPAYSANSILKAEVTNTPSALTIAEDRILGRITGGNIDDLTITQVLDMITGTPTAGDIFLRGASAYGRVAIGSYGQVLRVNSGGTAPEYAFPLTSGTAVNAATGSPTYIDFLSIPSWVKKIIVSLSAVSTNGSADLLLQIGDSGGIEDSGYSSFSGYVGNAGANDDTSTTGFMISAGTFNASYALSGLATLVCLDAASNLWISTTVSSVDGYAYFASGTKSLSATLNSVRIKASNGTDAFDGGYINILYL
jgi:hypothetical protein